MTKRILAATLWSITGWCIGAMIGWALDIGPALAPVVAVTLGLLIAADPRRVLWSRPTGETPLASEPTVAEPTGA